MSCYTLGLTARSVGKLTRQPRYISSSPSALITALVSRNLHLVALRISQHLGLRPDPVLKHWASAKIARSRTTDGLGGSGSGDDDEELCRAIVAKFKSEGEGSVSYAEIARGAWAAGRTRLATMVSPLSSLCLGPLADTGEQLLDHEPRAAEQVPLLLQMKEEKIALVKAIDSGETDLGKFHSSPLPRARRSSLQKFQRREAEADDPQCIRSYCTSARHYPQAISFTYWTTRTRPTSRLPSSSFRSMPDKVIDSCCAISIIRMIVGQRMRVWSSKRLAPRV